MVLAADQHSGSGARSPGLGVRGPQSRGLNQAPYPVVGDIETTSTASRGRMWLGGQGGADEDECPGGGERAELELPPLT